MEVYSIEEHNAVVGSVSLQEVVPDVPAGEALEAFCLHIGRQMESRAWHVLSPSAMAERIAQEFRLRFAVPTPLRSSLLGLLQTFDIALIRHEQVLQAVALDCEPRSGQWQLHLAAQPDARQNIRLLQGLFQLVFWRCAYRMGWWNQWRELHGAASPRRMADAFAYAVAMPPDILRERARQFGLNIWEMADALGVTPSACFYGLRRYARFTFPYFLARLDFSPELDQQQLFFDPRAVRAKVWSKFLARPEGASEDQPTLLDPLSRFPRQNSILEVKGYPYRAIKFRQPLIWTADNLLGLPLSKPTCFVARPNGQGTQLLLQAVPLGAHHFLMDRALTLQQEQARLQQKKAS